MKKTDLTILEEPLIEFANGQKMHDPHDGLTLFGPYDSNMSSHPKSIVYGIIGTAHGMSQFIKWSKIINKPIISKLENPLIWPLFPGFDVAFKSKWPSASASYKVSESKLQKAAKDFDAHKRSYEAVNLYLEGIELFKKKDESFNVIVCIVPDEVYKNCRPLSFVKESEGTGNKISGYEKKLRLRGEKDLFNEYSTAQYELSLDFRRQLKARGMSFDVPLQIILESTLNLSEDDDNKRRGLTPLSDRAWNLSTALYYKSGGKPWKLSSARDGVCYIGTAFRKVGTNELSSTACCAAQMFLSSGDGFVFMGEFGPWYSPRHKQFHLTKVAASELLAGILKNYKAQDGRELKEVFLHARSDISKDEFEGYKKACPNGVKLVGIRVRPEKNGLRMFRPGTRPVLRGMLLIINEKTAYLWASGFKKRIKTYDGWETPIPLRIDIQHGEADIYQVAQDIFGLTKLNYNACKLGSAMPITVGFSNAVGEILVSNPTITSRRANFKFYI